MTSIIIEDRNGETHVFLDQHSDDHIITKYVSNARGEIHEVMLPYGEWAWDRAVLRASRGAVFL